MWVVSQDEKKLIKSSLFWTDRVFVYCEDVRIVGVYDSKERAKEVLKIMIEHLKSCNNETPIIFHMPEE